MYHPAAPFETVNPTLDASPMSVIRLPRSPVKRELWSIKHNTTRTSTLQRLDDLLRATVSSVRMRMRVSEGEGGMRV